MIRVKFGGCNHLLQLLHADLLAALAFIDLFDDVPEYFDFFFFGFQHFLYLSAGATGTALIKNHHIRVGDTRTAPRTVGGPFET